MIYLLNKKKNIFIILLLVFLTACTQTQPQAESGSPTIDTHQKTQQVQDTEEVQEKNIEPVVSDEADKTQLEETKIQEAAIADVDPTSTVIEPEKQKEENESEDKYYPIVKVVDGDTIDVNIGDQTERIRIIGLNTPETVDPRKPVECFGQEASNKAKELLSGQEVRLEADITQGDRDKYGRLLRYIYLKDGTDFSLKMIKEGYGYEYTYDLPYNNQKQYDEAEVYARENEIGLWAPGMCVEEEKEAEVIPAVPVPNEPEPIESSGTADLKITYIFYDGEEGRSEPDEYVEIKNAGGPVNLKGYKLSDESEKIYTFKDFNLGTNQSVKVYTGCGDDTGSSLYWCFTSSAIWNNSGDTATLKDPGGGVVDSYNYKK